MITFICALCKICLGPKWMLSWIQQHFAQGTRHGAWMLSQMRYVIAFAITHHKCVTPSRLKLSRRSILVQLSPLKPWKACRMGGFTILCQHPWECKMKVVLVIERQSSSSLRSSTFLDFVEFLMGSMLAIIGFPSSCLFKLSLFWKYFSQTLHLSLCSFAACTLKPVSWRF